MITSIFVILALVTLVGMASVNPYGTAFDMFQGGFGLFMFVAAMRIIWL
jgi:hypothetical protein